MHRSRIAFSASAAMLLAGPALAQNVWIVDDDGGPGVHFTDIPPAIAAAASGDVLRVFPGSYSGFTLDKVLVIVGQPGGTVAVNSVARVANVTSGGSRVALSGLSAYWEVTGCTVPVLLDRCDGALEVKLSGDVRVQRSTYVGANAAIPPYYDGAPAVRADSSRLQLSDCTCEGGEGGNSSGPPYTDGGWGGDGVEGSSSDVHVYRSQIRGGNGGNGCTFLCVGFAGDGGDGIKAQSILAAGLPEHLISGGAAGQYYSPASPGYAISASSSLRVSGVSLKGGMDLGSGALFEMPSPADPALLLATPSPAAGQVATFRVNGPPGGRVELIVGRSPIIVPQGGLKEDLLVGENRRFVLGTIPPEGTVGLNFPVPVTLSNGFTFLAQAEVLYPSGETRYSNSVSVILR